MGLIDSNFLAGAAPGVTQMGAQLTAYGMTKSLQDQQEQARRDMEERIAERSITTEAAQHTRNRDEAVEDQGTAQTNALGLINAKVKAEKDIGETPLQKEQTKALKLTNETGQLLSDKRKAWMNETDPAKKESFQKEYQALSGKDPDKFMPVMGKDDAGNPVFMGMADTKNNTFTPAADVPSGIGKGRTALGILGETPPARGVKPAPAQGKPADIPAKRSLQQIDADLAALDAKYPRVRGELALADTGELDAKKAALIKERQEAFQAKNR